MHVDALEWFGRIILGAICVVGLVAIVGMFINPNPYDEDCEKEDGK
jgi:hypothetical protein